MTTRQRRFTRLITIGAAVAVAAYAIRGFAPELVRYLRIRRM